MAEIVNVVKQLFFFSIISTILVGIMPGEKYQKMMKIICGLIMILVLLRPILAFFSMDTTFSNIYQGILNQCHITELKSKKDYSSSENNESLIAQCEMEIQKHVESIVLENQWYPVKTEVVIQGDDNDDTYGQIRSIKVLVSKKETQNDSQIDPVIVDQINVNQKNEPKSNADYGDAEKLKNEIAKYYDLEMNRISVEVKNG